jgi:DNA-binding MarR family transcriptional regulator
MTWPRPEGEIADGPAPAAREANVLGALSLAVSDQIANSVAAATGLSGTAVAALSALHEFLDRPTVDQIRRVLGLTPSGAVRLIDRLADAGLVTRGPGTDGRTRAVILTGAGRTTAEAAAKARLGYLTESLSGLTPSERETLSDLLGRVMTSVVNRKDGGAWICRECDLGACQRADGRCPAMNAAMARRAASTRADGNGSTA